MEDELRRKPEHYYLAMIAYQIRRLRYSVENMFEENPKPTDFDIDDFLFDFTGENKKLLPKPPVVESEEERKRRLTHNSRLSAWWGAGERTERQNSKKRSKSKNPLPPEVIKKTAENLARFKERDRFPGSDKQIRFS